jgi:GT2 family glycosyltransferase
VDNVTLVVTSCGRPKLLQQTLDSFALANTFRFSRQIIIDGSCEPSTYEELERCYSSSFELMFNSIELGQAGTIDRAYNTIKSEYIFHCEDDWVFHGNGFVEQSLEILKENPKFLQVWIKDHDDCGHPRLEAIYKTRAGVPYKRVAPNYKGWRGFSWNPGLRRTADYHLIQPYTGNFHAGSKNPWEKAAGIRYSRLGFITVSTVGGYCRHAGRNCHIKVPPHLLNQTVSLGQIVLTNDFDEHSKRQDSGD